jgi:hypothetical protein
MFALAARSFAACCIGLAALSAQARELAIGFLLQADDERYSAQALEKAYPDAPSGRSAVAAKLMMRPSRCSRQAGPARSWSSPRRPMPPALAPHSIRWSSRAFAT